MKHIILAGLFFALQVFNPAYAVERTLSADLIEGINTEKNLLKGSSSHFEKNIGGWASFADASSATPVDLTGGASTLTCTQTTTTPLSGLGSLLITHSAADNRGNGCSASFTIDTKMKYKVLQIQLDYAISSGTFADNDMDIWIYDVTNSALIQPAPYHMKNHSLPADRLGLEFQATSGTSYRIGFYSATTTATAYTMRVDDIKISQTAKLYGSPITDGVSWTPTGSWVSNTTYTGVWQRVGGSLEAVVTVSTSGAPTSATLTVNIPPGLTIDTTKLTDTSFSGVIGQTTVNDSSTTAYDGLVAYSSTTAVAPKTNISATPITYQVVTQALPITFGAGDSVTLRFKVPILGWSSSIIMSPDASTNVVATRAYLSADQTGVNTNNTYVKINVDSTATSGLGYDKQGAWASNKYTVQTPGVYDISATIAILSTNVVVDYYQAAIYKNGAIAIEGGKTLASTVSTTQSRSVKGTLDLVAGDYLELYFYGGGNNSASTLTADGISSGQTTFIDISKKSGPAQIAASDTVAMRAGTTNAQAITSGSAPTITTWTIQDDTHGAFNVTTGIYTVPVSGRYHIESNLTCASRAWTTGSNAYIFIGSGGTTTTNFGLQTIWASQTSAMIFNGSTTKRYLAGDTILTFMNNNSGGTCTLDGSATDNWITITRVGNY